jgi:hypothetical protein
MTDNPDTPTAKVETIELANSGAETAPFIYFDGAIAFGMAAGGVVQIELAARTIVPAPGGETRFVHVVTAHLRGSPAAALDLKNAIESAFLLNAPTEGKAN